MFLASLRSTMLFGMETQAPFMPSEEIARRNMTFFQDRMTRLLQSTLVVDRGGSIAGFSSWSGEFLGQILAAATAANPSTSGSRPPSVWCRVRS